MDTPNGYDKMIEVFGDIKGYLREDGTIEPQWEINILDPILLPFSMKLSWDPTIIVTKIRCHHLLTDQFLNVFKSILDENLDNQCQYFGGCYSFRAKRGTKKISTHAWGIAIDLNPDTNQMRTTGDMNQRITEIFESFGFVWGGEFKDPMHFQFVKGY